MMVVSRKEKCGQTNTHSAPQPASAEDHSWQMEEIRYQLASGRLKYSALSAISFPVLTSIRHRIERRRNTRRY